MISGKSQREMMFSLVEAYKARTCNRKEFLEKHNLKASQFPYWITQYNRQSNGKSKTSDFIRLKSSSRHQDSLTVTLPNGIKINGSEDEVVSTTVTLYKIIK